MSPSWNIDPADVIKQGRLNVFTGLPDVSQDQFGFERLSERRN